MKFSFPGLRIAGFAAVALSLVPVSLMLAQRQQEHPAQFSQRGTHGAIAAGSGYATDAGMRMYYAGGNAVDAGVASIFAAATTEYSHVGWGGEAPILIRTRDGKVHSIAGVGTMPKLATADFYRKRPLRVGEVLEPPDKGGLKGMIPVAGIMAALVPGLPEASLVALRDYGTKSFSEVVEPALELADGSAIDEMRSGSIAASRDFFTLWPSSAKHFMPDGHVPMPGEVFHQADLARTIRGMVDTEKKALAKGANREAAIDAVRDYFYRGEIAKKIDEFSRAHEGLLRYDDMASFRVTPEEPVSTVFQGARVYKPGFWSQGPAMIEALNLLEPYELQSMRLNSALYIHTLTEALKLAYADRDTYYGDPKFSKIPAEELLSMKYAEERRKLIGPQASMAFRPGQIGANPPLHPSQAQIVRTKIDSFLMAHDTTCVDAIDKSGIMFSATPSGAWLPSVIAGDTGIPLTERAQSFLLVPGSPNELEGGKRPRVTLSPTLVTHTDGSPWFVLSTPGGDNQEQALMQILFAVVVFQRDAEAAIEVPRFESRHLVSSFDNHAMNPGDLQLDERTPLSVQQDLANRGHKVTVRSRWNSGSAPGLVRMTPDGVIEAGADPWGYRSMQAW
jgi:gamma-glutamyltranspeptidase/glutathione hydrolase